MKRKLIALFLVLALIASLGVTALAVDEQPAGRGVPANRALAATVLWVMAGQPVVNYALTYEDLDPEATYMEAVRWASGEGIVNGYSKTAFGPDDPITRQQLAAMLYRYAQKHGLGFTGAWYFPLDYPDAGEIAAWADEAMHWTVMNGLMEARDGKLEPERNESQKGLRRLIWAYMRGVGAETVAFQKLRLGTTAYTVYIPNAYVTGELTEGERADGMIAYYYSEHSNMDFDVYQFSKEGLPEDLMGYAAQEAADYGATAESSEINGVTVARYSARESYEGVEYTTLTAIVDAGADYLELVFWTDGSLTDYEARAVLSTLEQSAGTADSSLPANAADSYCGIDVASPDWVGALDAAKDADQMLIVAAFGEEDTGAWVSLHEKQADGSWRMVMTTPGFVGKLGVGKTREGDAKTPVGVFHFNRAFGIADDPGCAIPYVKVDGDTYWSGDPREGYHYNELVSLKDLPGLDLESGDSEHIIDYPYHYQYCLNISYNEEGVPGLGSAIFLHCLGPARPFTGGCVAIPEAHMRYVMQHVDGDTAVVIDTYEALSGGADWPGSTWPQER